MATTTRNPRKIICPSCGSEDIQRYLDETTDRVIHLCNDCGLDDLAMATTTAVPPLTPANISALNRLASYTSLMRDLRDLLQPTDFALLIQAEYTAYVCTMADHDCQCVALAFEEWKGTVFP